MLLELEEYFAGLVANPSNVRTFADLTAFNNAHPEMEKPAGYESQSYLETTANLTGYTPEYFKQLIKYRAMGRERGIDWVIKEHQLDALVLPANGFSFHPAAIAGYPVVTVPLGFFPPNTVPVNQGPGTVYPVPDVPFGLIFFGGPWREFELMGYAYDYEQATQTRLKRRAYDGAVPKTQLVDVIGK